MALADVTTGFYLAVLGIKTEVRGNQPAQRAESTEVSNR
jgi:hypothetical protein